MIFFFFNFHQMKLSDIAVIKQKIALHKRQKIGMLKKN